MKNTLKRTYGIMVKKVAKSVTSVDVNTACPFINYQPELPTKAKELRKF